MAVLWGWSCCLAVRAQCLEGAQEIEAGMRQRARYTSAVHERRAQRHADTELLADSRHATQVGRIKRGFVVARVQVEFFMSHA